MSSLFNNSTLFTFSITTFGAVKMEEPMKLHFFIDLKPHYIYILTIWFTGDRWPLWNFSSTWWSYNNKDYYKYKLLQYFRSIKIFYWVSHGNLPNKNLDFTTWDFFFKLLICKFSTGGVGSFGIVVLLFGWFNFFL